MTVRSRPAEFGRSRNGAVVMGHAKLRYPAPILGSTMPWEEYYPKPGQARGVQVDLKPDRLGLRYPVEIGLTGDVKATLQGLLPLLTRKTDRGFLQEAQRRMTDWNSAAG